MERLGKLRHKEERRREKEGKKGRRMKTVDTGDKLKRIK